MNQKKSRVVGVFAIRNFKFLGFTLGKNGTGIYVRVHGKSWKKMKSKLKELSSRRSVQSIRPSLEKIKVYMETMEEAENEGEESAENGSARRFGMEGRKQPKRLLVHHAYGS